MTNLRAPASGRTGTGTDLRRPSTQPKAPGAADRDATLSPDITNLAVAELRYQTAIRLEAIQAMADGVALGAQQVQDKRLDQLEVGPTTNTQEEIFLFLLVLVLEGTMGPALVALAVATVLRSLLRSAARAITVQGGRAAGELGAQVRLLRREARTVNSLVRGADRATGRQLTEIVADLRAQANRLAREGRAVDARFRATLTNLTELTRQNLLGGAKAALTVKYDVPGTDTPLPPGMSPGVEIQAAYMDSAAALRLTVNAVHEALEAKIALSKTTIGEVTDILDEYRMDGDINLSQVRATFQTGAEATIWAHLLLSNNPNLTQRGGAGTTTVPGGDLLDFGPPVDEKLGPYLDVRFSAEVERWALETGSSVPLLALRANNLPARAGPNAPRPTGWWDLIGPRERRDLLIQYLAALKEKTKGIFGAVSPPSR